MLLCLWSLRFTSVRGGWRIFDGFSPGSFPLQNGQRFPFLPPMKAQRAPAVLSLEVHDVNGAGLHIVEEGVVDGVLVVAGVDGALVGVVE